MIKALLFDFGDTVFVPDWKGMNEAMKEKTGLSIFMSPALKQFYGEEVLVGKASMRDIFEKMIVEADVAKSPQEVVAIYTTCYKKHTLIDQNMLDLIQKIQGGVAVYGFSNTNEIHAKVNEERGLFTIFKKVFLSYKLGVRKPDKRAFEAVLREINFQPEEVIFIDDREENVKSARELGIHALQYRSYEQLVENLKKLKLC